MVEDDFNLLVEALKDNVKVSFFAILKMDDYTDKWSLLFSGPRLADTEKKRKLFDEILPLIYGPARRLEGHDIARIGILPLTNHLVREISKLPGGSVLQKERANGNFIHEGYVLLNKNVARH